MRQTLLACTGQWHWMLAYLDLANWPPYRFNLPACWMISLLLACPLGDCLLTLNRRHWDVNWEEFPWSPVEWLAVPTCLRYLIFSANQKRAQQRLLTWCPPVEPYQRDTKWDWLCYLCWNDTGDIEGTRVATERNWVVEPITRYGRGYYVPPWKPPSGVW